MADRRPVSPQLHLLYLDCINLNKVPGIKQKYTNVTNVANSKFAGRQLSF